MDGANGLKKDMHLTAPVASSTLGVNVFTVEKTMIRERPRPLGEPLGFDSITSSLIFGDHDAVLVDAMLTGGGGWGSRGLGGPAQPQPGDQRCDPNSFRFRAWDEFDPSKLQAYPPGAMIILGQHTPFPLGEVRAST